MDHLHPRRRYARRVELRRAAEDRTGPTSQVRSITGSVVASGPFAGMKFVDEMSWGVAAPYLVGSCERELHSALESAIASCPRRVV